LFHHKHLEGLIHTLKNYFKNSDPIFIKSEKPKGYLNIQDFPEFLEKPSFEKGCLQLAELACHSPNFSGKQAPEIDYGKWRTIHRIPSIL